MAFKAQDGGQGELPLLRKVRPGAREAGAARWGQGAESCLDTSPAFQPPARGPCKQAVFLLLLKPGVAQGLLPSTFLEGVLQKWGCLDPASGGLWPPNPITALFRVFEAI